jgi:hypothetical protein
MPIGDNKFFTFWPELCGFVSTFAFFASIRVLAASSTIFLNPKKLVSKKQAL